MLRTYVKHVTSWRIGQIWHGYQRGPACCSSTVQNDGSLENRQVDDYKSGRNLDSRSKVIHERDRAPLHKAVRQNVEPGELWGDGVLSTEGKFHLHFTEKIVSVKTCLYG